jgi:hypothetical protein
MVRPKSKAADFRRGPKWSEADEAELLAAERLRSSVERRKFQAWFNAYGPIGVDIAMWDDGSGFRASAGVDVHPNGTWTYR